MDDSNFAEETVKRVLVSFVYTLRFKKNANQADQVSDMQKDVRKYVFEDYILCDDLGQEQEQDFLNLFDVGDDVNLDLGEGEGEGEGQRRRHLRSKPQFLRRLQLVERKPIGVSTGKKDERYMDLKCAEVAKGEQCVPMDGQFELLFADNADISPTGEENAVLAAIKNAIESGELTPSNPDTRGLLFIGKREGAFAAQSGVIPSAIGQNPNEDEKDGGGGVSAVGGVFIGGSLLVVVVALLAVKKRKESAHYERTNDCRDYDLHEIGPFEEDLDTLGNRSNAGSPDRNSVSVILRAAIKPGEISDDSLEVEYLTRDVHRCSSALCQQCSGASSNKRIPFIHSSEWYDDVEIDCFSHNSVRLDDGNSARTYAMPNTVTL